MRRRTFLAGLGSSLTCLALPSSSQAADTCSFGGSTISAITGPFPPSEFMAMAAGRANPGARLAVAENDMDLTIIKGSALRPIGQIVELRCRVITRECLPVARARVELWQADTNGCYNHENERRTVSVQDLDPAFGYWGSTETDADGRFVTRTIVPGAYPAGGSWWRPPHLHWSLQARGLRKLTTQTYFDGEVLAGVQQIRQHNEADLILNLKNGFNSGLAGHALDLARKRVRSEQIARFTSGHDGVATADLTLRMDTST